MINQDKIDRYEEFTEFCRDVAQALGDGWQVTKSADAEDFAPCVKLSKSDLSGFYLAISCRDGKISVDGHAEHGMWQYWRDVTDKPNSIGMSEKKTAVQIAADINKRLMSNFLLSCQKAQDFKDRADKREQKIESALSRIVQACKGKGKRGYASDGSGKPGNSYSLRDENLNFKATTSDGETVCLNFDYITLAQAEAVLRFLLSNQD